jgi:hypothetical protein
MVLHRFDPSEREADMGEAMKHIAWAYAAWTLAIVVRLWAVPFFVLGWISGVTIDAFGFGWKAAFDCPLGKWAGELHRAHQPKRVAPTKVRCVAQDDDDDDLDDDDSFDNED